MKWFASGLCIILLLCCIVKSEARPTASGEQKPGGSGGEQNPGGGGGEQKPLLGGSGEQKPGGSGEQKPLPGGSGEQKPGISGEQKPLPGGSGEQKPGGSGGEQNPGGGGGEQKPLPGGSGEQKPGVSGEQKPGGSGEQKPGGSGEQKPGEGGGGQTPGGSGGEQKPGEKIPEAKGDKKDGDHKKAETLSEEKIKSDTSSKKNEDDKDKAKHVDTKLVPSTLKMNGPEAGGQNPFQLEHKIVHLDLKAAPPKIEYFNKLFPYLKSLGATGLLVEYDGMFPFSGSLLSIRDAKAYKTEQVKELVRIAKENKLDIIPLIHTFGHMQFLLEEQEFFDLREIISRSDFLCPSANRTHEILHAMIDQILALHEDTKWVHIGSDEVFQLGKCTRCIKKKKESKMDNNHLFLGHVSKVAEYLRDKHKVQPIMWDDMLQPIPKEVLTELQIPNLVIPMIWKFNKEVRPDLYKDTWEKYISTFPKLWIASAFKGDKQISDMKTHLDTHKNWVDLLKTYGNKIQFTGMALTGWQRYTHFSELPELMAISIPSLTLDLLFLKNGGQLTERLFEDATKALQCNKPLSLDWNFGKEQIQCNFPGSEIFTAVEKYDQLRSKMEETDGKGSDTLKIEVRSVEKEIRDSFKKIYYEDTLEEWKNSFLNPIKTMLGMVDALDLPHGGTIIPAPQQKKAF